MFDYDEFRKALRALVACLYGPVTSAEWLTYDAENQELLNTAMKAVDKVYGKKLRPAYDDALVDGKESGKVRSGLEPVRARKTKEIEAVVIPTSDEFLDDILGETDSAETEAEAVTLDIVS